MNSGEFEVFFTMISIGSCCGSHASYYEIYFFLKWGCDLQVDGNRYELQYGDYLMILRDEAPPHLSFHRTDYRRFVLWISRPIMTL